MSISIEQGLVEFIKNNAGLNGLIGERIFALNLPQTCEFPAISYNRVSNPRPMTHDQDSTGLSSPRFQFDIYAESYSAMVAVALALRNCLLGFRGEFGTVEKIKVYGILFEHEQDFPEPETGLYRKVVDYKISHEE